jgi:hypothetical protein
MWTCPKCKREFTKTNQSHSCRIYPLENHFKGKEIGKPLFDEFVKRIESNIGPVKIDSPECCIHLMNGTTFAAAWIGKNKIKIDFRVAQKLKSGRFTHELQMSANRFLYHMDIMDKGEIDDELLAWLKESYLLAAET